MSEDLHDLIARLNLIESATERGEVARVVAGEIAKYLERDEPLPRSYREYLADALNKVARGWDANDALTITGWGGRPRKDEQRRHVYDRVEALRGQGRTLADCYRTVADELPGLDSEDPDGWVKKAYQREKRRRDKKT